MPPTGDLASNPGMCPPDQESNWQPFGLQAGAQSTEPHQLGLDTVFMMNNKFGPCGRNLRIVSDRKIWTVQAPGLRYPLWVYLLGKHENWLKPSTAMWVRKVNALWADLSIVLLQKWLHDLYVRVLQSQTITASHFQSIHLAIRMESQCLPVKSN